MNAALRCGFHPQKFFWLSALPETMCVVVRGMYPGLPQKPMRVLRGFIVLSYSIASYAYTYAPIAYDAS